MMKLEMFFPPLPFWHWKWKRPPSLATKGQVLGTRESSNSLTDSTSKALKIATYLQLFTFQVYKQNSCPPRLGNLEKDDIQEQSQMDQEVGYDQLLVLVQC